MSFTPYSPSDTHHASLSVPDNGEDADSANLFDGTAKYNADNGLYLYNRMVGCKGGELPIPLNTAEPSAGTGSETKDWTLRFDPAAPWVCWEQTAVIDADDGHLWIPMPVVWNAAFDRIVIYLQGAAHGGSWPPTNMPVLRLIQQQNSLAGTQIGTVTDSSSQGTYETVHPLTLNLGADYGFAASGNDFYWLHLRGESDTNAVAALRLFTARVRMKAA